MKMLINADDFGRSTSINAAIKDCFYKGLINQTTIMTNMPAFQEAVWDAKNCGFFDKVGLHLTLDEGIPVSDRIKSNPHFCKDGVFVKGCIKGLRKLHLNAFDKQCLEEEIEAQMALYKKTGFPLLHLDSHHHVHTNLSILMIVAKLAKLNGFRSMRKCAFFPNESVIKRLYKTFINSYISRRFYTQKMFIPFKEELRDCEQNVEMMVHPDYIDSKLVDVIKREPLKFVVFR